MNQAKILRRNGPAPPQSCAEFTSDRREGRINTQITAYKRCRRKVKNITMPNCFRFARIRGVSSETTIGSRMVFHFRVLPRVPASLVILFALLAVPQQSAGPQIRPEDSIQRARQLAWLNNWTEAARVLERLKGTGRLNADQPTTLFSNAVEIRVNIEASPLPAAARDLAEMLSSGVAQRDLELRLQILAMKGDVEFQYDLPAAEKTWTEVRELAS